MLDSLILIAKMSKLRPPEQLSFDTQHCLAEQWEQWAQEMRLYLNLAMAGDTEKDQCSAFLYIIGRKGREIFNTWTLNPDTEVDKIEVLFKKFKDYCEPKKNIIIERYKFNTRAQNDGETLDEYLTDLTKLAKRCEYGALEVELIRDRLVCGIQKQIVKERLLREPKLTLDLAISICRAEEESQKSLSLMRQEEVNAIRRRMENNKPFESVFDCGKCGLKHPPRQCPAFKKVCHKCKRTGHFAKMCRSRAVVQEINTDGVQEINTDGEEREYWIGCIDSIDSSKDWRVELMIKGRKVRAKVDTGAQVNVISKTLTDKLGVPLANSSAKLTSYSGDIIPVAGKATLICDYKNNAFSIDFIVTSAQSATTILGLETSEKMNLFQRVNEIKRSEFQTINKLVTEYEDTFGSLGCFESKHHIEIDPKVEPIVSPPRRVPLAQRKKLSAKLAEMESDGVIKKVEDPTEWVNPMIIVNKPDGSIRICMDPKRLNSAIKREHFQLPTMEELTLEMNEAKYFTKLDASSGFWQIPLDDSSSYLCTFATPFGRYRFCRLPFGIKSAPEVFQKEILRHFGDLPGVVNFEDDLCVWSKTLEEHVERLKNVFERARKCGIKFNRKKCEFAKIFLPYLGHILTQDGIKVDENKVFAIKNMPIPQNKEELMRFLGMVTYLTKFIPTMSTITAPLRRLLEKDIEWLWMNQHTDAVNHLKDLISNAPILAYFDVNKEVTIMADASKYGLGAVILQENRPIAYASRSLTPTEMHYAVIEKEMLAVVFAMEKFHQYIYGKHVTVESDHKPLVSIQNKAFHNCPARIQRFLLRLQKYDFEIKYVKGKDQVLADALSRAVAKESSVKTEIPAEEMEAIVTQILSEIPATNAKKEDIKQKQIADEECQVLLKLCKEGWPETIDQVSEKAKPYWSFREEIVENNGLILKSTQIIIPKEMRKEMLKKIHEGHLGIELCRRRAKSSIYWPGMSKDIETEVQKCATCQKYKNKQQKETLISHEIPQKPYTKVGADLFTLFSKDYLLVVDYTSKDFEVCILNDTTSMTVVHHMKHIFSRHGIPDILFSDNGPQFTAKCFKTFTKEWNIVHQTSSPTYPQSNGLVERTVQTVKNLIKKARDSQEDPYISILNFRTTPKADGKSPAEILMGRKLTTLLPESDAIKIVQNKVQQTEKKNYYYDMHARDMAELKKGDFVRYRNNATKTWEPAQIVEKLDYRSYVIQSATGTYRRNRRSLMKTGESESDLQTKILIETNSPDAPASSTTVETNSPDVPASSTTVAGSNENSTPPPVHSSGQTTHAQTHTSTNNTYQTRSGRVVKPNPRYT